MVVSTEFPEQIQTWQNALPVNLSGKLDSVSGRKLAVPRPSAD